MENQVSINIQNGLKHLQSLGTITKFTTILWIIVCLILFALVSKQRSEISTLLSQKEKDLEQIHSVAYDQGYVSAIWDTYLDKPLYRIVEEEETGNPTLWRKTEVDPINKEKLDAMAPKTAQVVE